MLKFNIKNKSANANICYFAQIETNFPSKTIVCTESFCHFQTTSLKKLKIHLIHHLQYLHFNYVCKCCKFGCISQEGLKQHMLDSHGNLIHFMLD